MLIKLNANINLVAPKKETEGTTALVSACSRGHIELSAAVALCFPRTKCFI